ncbi:LLM class flavin-dependent oxidoreductase, partial [Mycolicibacterium sp.]
IKGERPTFSGKYYRTQEAMANPRFRDHIPLLIGGSGEKKTIPLAVQHFDHLNLIVSNVDEIGRKIEVIKARCEDIGRDPATLETSTLVGAIVGENIDRDLVPEEFRDRLLLGSPEAIAEQIKTKVLDAGVNGVIVFVPTQVVGYQPGNITALGEALKPLVSG